MDALLLNRDSQTGPETAALAENRESSRFTGGKATR